MQQAEIWRKLVSDKSRYVDEGALRLLCEKAGREYRRVVKYLLERNYLLRVFRGVFYVRSPEEIELNKYQDSVEVIVAKALKLKGVKLWYFGLETGLKLNQMTHEYFATSYVITDSYRTTKVIKILNQNFRFYKWAPQRLNFGIIRRGGLAYSDLEKTVLDLCYRAFNLQQTDRAVLTPVREYGPKLDQGKIEDHLAHYPRPLAHLLKGEL